MSRSKTVDMAEGSSLNEIIGEEDNSQVNKRQRNNFLHKLLKYLISLFKGF